MSSSVLDYADRTVDLNIFYGVPELGEALLEQALALPGGSGALISGPQRVVQEFLLLLFKIRGSDATDPESGCEFMSDAWGGYFRTPLDVRSSFSAAEAAIRGQLAARYRDDTPDDERYASAELLRVVLTPATGLLYLQPHILTVAGVGRTFLFPIREPLR